MNLPAATSQYMLLFRGIAWDDGISPEEVQSVLDRWDAWFDRLTQEGKATLGQPLTHDGTVVSGGKGQKVVDGPFAESQEAVAGYILLRVASLEEATAIAKECPGLEYGMSVEVRPIDESMGRGPV
jgi:hypothetical protein